MALLTSRRRAFVCTLGVSIALSCGGKTTLEDEGEDGISAATGGTRAGAKNGGAGGRPDTGGAGDNGGAGGFGGFSQGGFGSGAGPQAGFGGFGIGGFWAEGGALVAGNGGSFSGICGDGAKGFDEACDEGLNPTQECEYGATSCKVCSASCVFVLGTTSYCGDGTTDETHGETCDDGNAVDTDGCKNDCTKNAGLKIAIESLGTCTGSNQANLVLLSTILTERGHVPALVDHTALDTAPEIANYDVIVLGGYTANCDMVTNDLGSFDALIPGYLALGHGLVGTGWILYSAYLNNAPNITAALPTIRTSDYLTGSITFTTVGSHPIVSDGGVEPFGVWDFAACAGGTKQGATTLLSANGTDCAAAWTSSSGRVVFLGPLFLEYPTLYDSKSLLDGFEPGALELLLRSIEWAGGIQ